MANLFAEAAKLHDLNVAFAIATIIEQSGSTPRSTAKMIVKSDGSISGTVGGGLAEAYVIGEALEAIRENRSRVVEYVLNSEAANGIQMLCGGKLAVFIEVVSNRPKIMMIGAGHVGKAISGLVDFLGYKLSIIDDRQEYACAEMYPMAVEICYDPEIDKAIEQAVIDNNTYIVIATKDSDMKALRKVIDSEAAYIGMIGSKRKVLIVLKQLESEGISRERIKFIHAPFGLDLGSETPEEIAVSALAEILKVRNGKTGMPLREFLPDRSEDKSSDDSRHNDGGNKKLHDGK